MYLPRTWPVGIPLLTDESFSSWFARIAWAHGAAPSERYRIACLSPITPKHAI